MTLAAKYQFEAIGTQWSIETERPLSSSLIVRLQKLIDSFDQTYSRFRSDSLVTNTRSAPGSYSFPESTTKIFDTYDKLSAVTRGAVNPLVGESLEALGYDAAYSLKQTNLHKAPKYPESLTRNGSLITTKEPLLIDIGAIGKGYLIDELAEMVGAEHPHYVIDGSGDMAIHTKEPETIGLEDPREAGRVIGHVSLGKGSLCASATNRRSWGEGLHHIVDARTGGPTRNIIATWAIADSTMLADALTTALFFTSPEELMKTFGSFNYAIMNVDGSVAHNITTIGELYS